jgi:thioredoxin-like negative regulator of GroEL
MNVDENPKTPMKFNVRGIPTLIVFHKGKEVARTSGALDQNSLDRWLNDGGRAMPQDSK